MSLMCVRLELARDFNDATGNPNDAYEFTVPLTDDGHIDLSKWADAAPYCALRRYQRDGSVLPGQLIRTDRGEWAFSYQMGEDDDEYIYRFASHVFKPGEYLSITQNDETDHVYRVAAVTAPLLFGT